jgi:hypothetical protein
MVLVILVDCGLIQALVKLGQEKDDLANFNPTSTYGRVRFLMSHPLPSLEACSHFAGTPSPSHTHTPSHVHSMR